MKKLALAILAITFTVGVFAATVGGFSDPGTSLELFYSGALTIGL